MQSAVFVSCPHDADRPAAGALARLLRHAGYEVLFPAAAGQPEQYETPAQQIARCGHFVLLLGPDVPQAGRSTHEAALRELTFARSAGCQIVPLLWDGLSYSDLLGLPGALAELTALDAVLAPSGDLEGAAEELDERFLRRPQPGPQAPSAPQTDEQAARQRLHLAQQHLQRGDYRAALAACNEALRLQPDLSDAHYRRGQAHAGLGNVEAAAEDWGHLLEQTPDDLRAGIMYSSICRLRGDHDRALVEALRAVQSCPHDADAYFCLGLAYRDAGRHDSAAEALTRALELCPLMARAYYYRAVIHGRRRRYDRAIADYTEALRLHPSDARCYYNRGKARSSIGDHEGAIADYTEAIGLRPAYAEAYNNRGIAYWHLGQPEAAIEDYTRSIELKNPRLHLPYNNRGQARYELGDTAGAIADFRMALQIAPDYTLASENLASVQRDLLSRRP